MPKIDRIGDTYIVHFNGEQFRCCQSDLVDWLIHKLDLSETEALEMLP